MWIFSIFNEKIVQMKKEIINADIQTKQSVVVSKEKIFVKEIIYSLMFKRQLLLITLSGPGWTKSTTNIKTRLSHNTTKGCNKNAVSSFLNPPSILFSVSSDWLHSHFQREAAPLILSKIYSKLHKMRKQVNVKQKFTKV